MRRKLSKAAIHNLNEQRNEGFIGHELQILGEQNIEPT